MGHESEDIAAPASAHPNRAPLIALGVVVVLVAAIFGIVYASGGEERAAKGACQKAIEDRLTAPSTARWTFTLVWKDGGAWLVNGQVDAQNTFGAQVRSGFKCTVTDGAAVVDYLS